MIEDLDLQVTAIGQIGDVLVGEQSGGRIALALGDIEVAGRPNLRAAIDDLILLLERRKRSLLEIVKPPRILRP